MSELQIVNQMESEITAWDFETLKSQFEEKLSVYKNMVYTDDSIRSAKDDKAYLNKVKKALEDKRKAYKAECMAPYEAVEPKIKELVNMVEEQRLLIDETVKDYENRKKAEKEKNVKAFYDKKAFALGEYGEKLYEKLLDPKWLNASTGKKQYEEGVITAINKAANDIAEIKAMESTFYNTLMEIYIETVDIEKVKAKDLELIDSAQKAGIMSVAGEVSVTAESSKFKSNTSAQEDGGIILKVYASEYQLEQLCDFMKAIGVTYELQ
ncbi:MAG: DUF1351 domain-containing protein [Lachnospiraceae bacterium]|nr:DUF1351 domain-containing protein [Lachnospiraceae bacterium]